jgi:serine/threonine protein kinase/Tfp pilus assembly protein PilF
MSSSEIARCAECGGELPPGLPRGLCPRCALQASATPSDSQAPPRAQAGDHIGRYKLLQKIGEGGMGDVWMAEQSEPIRRKVALKVIKLGMDTRSVIARFEAERQALALMDHPNIARVLDAGATETGRPYFVMELVRGVRITQYCDEHRLTTRARLDLFTQVCNAIQHAHQKGIIHRDIKPSNILVTLHDGMPVPKVIDFGIAKATSDQRLTDKTLFTAFEQFMGTPAYMSPEQAEMSGLDIDTRTDIYALGVLLYELLTGVTPFNPEEFRKAGLDEIRRMIRETEPPKPSTRLESLGAKLPDVAMQRRTEPAALSRLIRGDLDWIVMRCLDKDRKRRYETANGLAADVARHLDNEPVIACPPSNLYLFQKLVRRNKIAFVAFGGIALALLLGLGSSTWLFFREREARQRAVAAEVRERELRKKAQTSELSARALLNWKEGKLAEAESLQQESLALWRENLGHHHPQIATGLETLAAIVRDRGRLDESIRIYKEALKLQTSGELDLQRLGQELSRGSYNEIESYLGRVLPDAGRRTQMIDLLKEHGLAVARQGQWRNATADFTRFVEINPTDPDASHALAALLVHTGDQAGYRRHCAFLLQQFGETKDPVQSQALIRDCLLLPDHGTNSVHLIKLSGNLLTTASDHWAAPWFQLAVGLAEFREVHFANAAQRLQQLPRRDQLPEREAQTLLVLAMSQYQLNQIPTARATLAKAIQIVETKLPKIEDGLLGPDWVDWIQTHVLLREARLMVENN